MISLALAAAAALAGIEAMGGAVVYDRDGEAVEISLARTWATDKLLDTVTEAKRLKRLDLSFTYVTDRGLEKLARLPALEELSLDTAEFITDAGMSFLRANKSLRKLVLRGTDVTDISLPYLATLTNLQSLDLSQTMLGDGGLESLPALTRLEELYLGGSRITGLNFNLLRLLPQLKRLRLGGVQRRNGGACWTATIIDADLDALANLSGLEELDLGAGVGLGRAGRPNGAGNCRLTGGVQITDAGLIKLGKLTKLRRLDLSGAKLTAKGLETLRRFVHLERLSLWNCRELDGSAAAVLARLTSLKSLDLSATPFNDAALERLGALPQLARLYLTDTAVTASAATAFRATHPACFVSWANRPEATAP